MPSRVRRLRSVLSLLAILAGAAALAGPATAALTIPAFPVKGNPAERLRGVPIDAAVYERASRCLPNARRRGTEQFVAWLGRVADGQLWGIYRCEIWGPGSASLHAEKRAVDWHLDASSPADQREAQRVIALLTAPDSAGNPHALARRMGVGEIIWDCAYWGAGMAAFRPYSPCLTRRGRISRSVNRTIAHRDHIHFGLTRAGATVRTSFWREPGAHAQAPRPGNRNRGERRPGGRRRTERTRVAPARARPVAPDVAPAPGGGMQTPAAFGR